MEVALKKAMDERAKKTGFLKLLYLRETFVAF